MTYTSNKLHWGTKMDFDIAALVATGGTALVEIMATDAWSEAKHIIKRLFGRSASGNDDAGFDAELEEARTEVIEARDHGDAQRESELVTEWSSRIRRTVQSNPEASQALIDLIELRKTYRDNGTGDTSSTNTAIANDKSRVYQQGSGQQYNF
ncbi:hypothetical protein [Pseudonocardia sp. T1-2H]|uniref:hypothetical protein n=1 Tax=Pseudonocardia sp. T1-2H TaxID=3128899 RepID=UPI0031017C6F